MKTIKGIMQFLAGIGLMSLALLFPKEFLFFSPIHLAGASWMLTILLGFASVIWGITTLSESVTVQ
jgi:hypothetical protein